MVHVQRDGVAQGDMKADNVWIGSDGHPKICDFDGATFTDSGAPINEHDSKLEFKQLADALESHEVNKKFTLNPPATTDFIQKIKGSSRFTVDGKLVLIVFRSCKLICIV